MSKSFKKHVIVFDVWDENFVPQNIPFAVVLDIVKEGDEVTIKIPAMNWQQTVSGYLYTQAGFLPKKLRPSDNLAPTTTLESDLVANVLGYDLQVRQDGNIVITNKGNTPIPIGPQVSHAKTFSYLIDKVCWKPPQNFALSNGFSQTAVNFPTPSQFLDWYTNSFVHGIIASSWADNSTVPITQTPNQLNTYARTGRVTQDRCGRLSVALNNVVPVIVTGPNITPAENSISINPTNPNNIVLTTNYRDGNAAVASGNRFQLWRGVSFDGGVTWPTVGRIDSFIGAPGLLPGGRADANGIFDRFGNYWVTYLTSAINLLQPFSLAVGVSTDGGVTFTTARIFAPDPQFPLGYDYPQIAFGGDGNGGWAIYISCSNSGPTGGAIFLAYIPVSGLGVYDGAAGMIVNFQSITVLNSVVYQSLFVSDSGKVFILGVAGQYGSPQYENAQSQTSLIVKPDGINNFVDGNILGPFGVEQLNLGFFASPPWNALRTINPQSCFTNVVYDNDHNVLYMTWVDADSETPDSYQLYFAFSQNDGRTWSQRLLVSDSSVNTRGLHSIALNQDTGDLYFSWYDARNSPVSPSGNTGEFVEYFGAVIPFSKIERLLDCTEITTLSNHRIIKNKSRDLSLTKISKRNCPAEE